MEEQNHMTNEENQQWWDKYEYIQKHHALMCQIPFEKRKVGDLTVFQFKEMIAPVIRLHAFVACFVSTFFMVLLILFCLA